MAAMKPLRRKNLPVYIDRRVNTSLLEGLVTERLNISFEIDSSEVLMRGRRFRSRTEMTPSSVFGLWESVFRTRGRGMSVKVINRWVGPIKQKSEVKSKRHSGSTRGSHA